MLHSNKRAFFDEWKRSIMDSGWCFCRYCFPRVMLSLLALPKWKEWWRPESDEGTAVLVDYDCKLCGQAPYRCWWHHINMMCLKRWLSIIMPLINVLIIVCPSHVGLCDKLKKTHQYGCVVWKYHTAQKSSNKTNTDTFTHNPSAHHVYGQRKRSWTFHLSDAKTNNKQTNKKPRPQQKYVGDK